MLRVIPFLVRLHVKSEMEYRGAFLLDRLAQIVAYAAGFAALWILVAKFETLGGWDWPELALLLSFQLLVYAIGASFSFVQMREIEDLIHRGQFDALMVKPFSPWAYIVFSQFNIAYIGHGALALGLMAWSLSVVDVAWDTGTVLYFVATTMSASLFIAALITMIGASAFIIVKSRYLYNILFGLFELIRYPLSIFPPGIQWLLLAALPVGFINYVPVSYMLGKDIPLIGDIGGLLAPLVGPLSVVIAALFWRFAIRRYQGAGG